MSDQNGYERRSTCGRPKADGSPCGQVVGPAGCLWHGDGVTAEDRRAIAMAGSVRARVQALQRLPADAPVPAFQSRDQIVAYAENRAHLVETGQLDPRLSAEARGWAQLAMAAWELEALLRVQRLERRLKRKRVGA